MSITTIYNDLVVYFGGQSKLAKALGCTQPSVWAWINGTSNMSATFAIKAERLTGGKFKATDLCPALAEIEAIKETS